MSQAQYAHNNVSQTELEKTQHDLIETASGGVKPVLADGTAYVPGTDEEKRLVRKIDRHLLPMLWVMYVMNYIDRTNIGVRSSSDYFMTVGTGKLTMQNAKVGGMQADLNLSSSDYSLVLSIFFVVSAH